MVRTDTKTKMPDGLSVPRLKQKRGLQGFAKNPCQPRDSSKQA
jgi:hypothetical protein